MSKPLLTVAILLATFLTSGCSKQAPVEQQPNEHHSDQQQEQQAKINQLQKENDQQQVKIEELEDFKETQLNQNKAEAETPTPTRSVSDEVYCQTNADKYTKEKYKDYEDTAEDARKSCIDKDSDACDKVVDKMKDSFKKYKAEYEEYHIKCK